MKFVKQGQVVHSGHGGRVMGPFLICRPDPPARNFRGADRDGGTMEFTREDAGRVLFRRFGLANGCGAITNMVGRPGANVRYRLDRVGSSYRGGV